MITKVYFDNIDIQNELGLLLAKRKIGTPRIKKRMIDVPGGDPLDYTEFFGEAEFENRQITLSFNKKADKDESLRIYREFQNLIHGKKMKIRFSDEPEFYYAGRIEIGDYEPRRTVFKIDVNIDASPFKFKTEKTSKTFYISGTQTVTVNNMRKKVVPEITTNSEMTIKKGNVSVALNSGTYRYPELQLDEGDNVFTVTNNSYYGDNITFSYQEGGF